METQVPPDLETGEDLAIPLAMNFQAMLPAPGGYSFEVLIDKVHQKTLSFRAMPPTGEEEE